MRRLPASAALAAAFVLTACADGYGYQRGGYGYAYEPYWGWYGDYYYPGTGFYVYDRYRRAYRWDDRQRHYWETRRQGYRGAARDNWAGFGGSNGYRYDDKSGRERAAGFGNRGYRTRATVAVPQDAQPPAYRAGAPERPAGGREGYRRPPSSHDGGRHDHHDRH